MAIKQQQIHQNTLQILKVTSKQVSYLLKQFKTLDIYSTEFTSLQLNLLYLHIWMIKHSLQYDNYIQSKQLDILLNRFIQRDNKLNAYQFKITKNEFDIQIHDELKRMKRCLFRSLDDYFYYGNNLNRDLNDIIYLDVLNEKESDPNQIKNIAQYVDEQVKNVNKPEIQKLILKEEFEWTQQNKVQE